ncbi:MAG: zinc ribbon domain-containing protein [Desulfatibacillum sp.]|nr:zinc ribbon domain-containing protein [Desulfatibacillum sp.]
MNDNEIITCLANILSIAGVDQKLLPQEEDAIECIRQELGAEHSLLEEAIALIHGGEYTITPAGRFSDQIRNLEDMLFVSMADNELALEEKREILHFAKMLKLTQDQINGMLAQTKALIRNKCSACPACGAVLDPTDNFCTECGARIS